MKVLVGVIMNYCLRVLLGGGGTYTLWNIFSYFLKTRGQEMGALTRSKYQHMIIIMDNGHD
jgi:hypothetical protein